MQCFSSYNRKLFHLFMRNIWDDKLSQFLWETLLFSDEKFSHLLLRFLFICKLEAFWERKHLFDENTHLLPRIWTLNFSSTDFIRVISFHIKPNQKYANSCSLHASFRFQQPVWFCDIMQQSRLAPGMIVSAVEISKFLRSKFLGFTTSQNTQPKGKVYVLPADIPTQCSFLASPPRTSRSQLNQQLFIKTRHHREQTIDGISLRRVS